MDHRLVTAALAVLLASGLAACGAGTTDTGSSPAPGRSPGDVAPVAPTTPVTAGPGGSPTLPPGPIATLPRTAKPPAKLTPSTGELTLTGTVESGIEAGCLVMRSGGQAYQLMDGDPKVVRAGARLVITGHLATGMVSYCMQGLLFHITSAHPA